MRYTDIVWAVRQNTQERYNERRLLMWKIRKATHDKKEAA